MGIEIDRIAWQGWPHCVRLSNGRVDLVATTDVGPRIAHLATPGSANLLAVLEEQAGLMGGDEWRLYGGHRLWHSPQVQARTELPDNAPVASAVVGDTLRLVQPVEQPTGIGKEIEISLAPDEAHVRVRHLLHNTGLWAVDLAPWALSAMRRDGVAIVPQATGGAGNDRLPNRLLALWPFGDGSDARFAVGTHYSLLRQDPGNPAPFKVGMNANSGWAAYYSAGQLLIKCCAYRPDLAYPDYGCSVELFVCGDFLELETLGPLVRLEPGATAEHIEHWFVYAGVAPVETEGDVDRHVRPLAEALRAAARW